ncbi:pentatricopeptide repeat-containing protein At1g62670, mitochondrial-like [Papaver somniferum]|uniref:pentatricopeptide repeat-containing protein At1g62670, mitochondrial-like n=1 Tax=Papaver somniferum TaxID=3469 RepID=UPI000E6F92D6|nr:pentatricopeptide repeat-containing protein At1g62670, mitochondrial-like [Papaver somniferum]
MKTAQRFLNEITYGTSLDGLCKNGKIVEEVELFESMDGTGILANVEMYHIVINGLCRACQLENARELFNEIPNEGLVPDVVAYNTMMAGLFHHRQFLEAKKLFIQMEGNGCLPNSRIYDTVIKGFIEGKETETALQFLRRMRERKFVPMIRDVVVAITGKFEKLNMNITVAAQFLKIGCLLTESYSGTSESSIFAAIILIRLSCGLLLKDDNVEALEEMLKRAAT